MTKKLTLDGVEYRLAPWLSLDEQYQDLYVPLDPALRFLPNRGDGLVADEGSTYWHVDSFKGGEGYDLWNPERQGFFKGLAIRRTLASGGDGIEVGPNIDTTPDSGGATDFAAGGIFGRGMGELFTIQSASAYQWDKANDKWGSAIATGSVSTATSMADFQDGSNMLSMHTDGEIRKWNSGANSQHFGSGTFSTSAPVIHAWGGRVFALDEDDLYEIDLTAVNTRTLLRDVDGESSDYLASPWAYRRMASSDLGPIWLQRLDSGETHIWQYNVAQEVGARIGKLPVDFAFPYDIYFSGGFIFVAFREAAQHSDEGEAYVYYQRGGQRGVLGPIDMTGATAAPVLIAGVVGSDLIISAGPEIFAYSFNSGGIFPAGFVTSSFTNIENAMVFGSSAFLHVDSNDKIERANFNEYTTKSGATFGAPLLQTGWYDLAYFDIPKLFLDVTVFTDPLAANESVDLAYAVDRGSFTSHADSHDTDGATSKTFTLSSSSTTVRGRRIAFQLKPIAGSASSSPVIRGFLVRGIAGAHERRFVLAVDCSTDDAGEQDAETVVSNLRTLAAKDEIVSLSMPFEKRDGETPETLDVSVRAVRIPSIDRDKPTAVVELQATVLTS